MAERFSVSVPPVANDICRSAVPAPKYLPERRSTVPPRSGTTTPLLDRHSKLENTQFRVSDCIERRLVLLTPFRNIHVALYNLK